MIVSDAPQKTWWQRCVGLAAVLLPIAVGGGCTASPSVTPETVPANTASTAEPEERPAPAEPEERPAPAEPSEPVPPADPFAPFPVASQLEVSVPDYLLTEGRVAHGGATGPINTNEADRDFFTAPEFDTKGNSGRLFYTRFELQNPSDPDIPSRILAFVSWQPLNTNGKQLAQLIPNRDGYDLYEITTDGKRLLAEYEPAYGAKATAHRTDPLVWKGDRFGHGRFVPEGNHPFPHLVTAPRAEFERERDRGYEALNAHEYDEAIAAFMRAIAVKPKDAACRYALGRSYEGTGVAAGSEKGKRAIAAYSEALAREPKRTDAWRRRATLYQLEKQYDRAVADATHVIALAPHDADSYLLRASIYDEMAAHDRAVADARQATRLARDEVENWEALTIYQYRDGKYPEAILSANVALGLDDSHNLPRLVQVYVAVRQGQKDKALSLVKAARENGVTTDERRDALRELLHIRKAHPGLPALEPVYTALSGSEKLDPTDE